MLTTVSIKSFRIDDPSAVVLGGDVFFAIDKCKGKSKETIKNHIFCEKILDALSKRMFCGLISDLEYGKARNAVGESKFYQFLNEKIHSGNVRFFKISVANFLREYRQMAAYAELFRLTDDGNMRIPHMASIIASVELKKPIVSYDNHFWIYQNRITKAGRERYGKPDLQPLLTPQDLYNRIAKPI